MNSYIFIKKASVKSKGITLLNIKTIISLGKNPEYIYGVESGNGELKGNSKQRLMIAQVKLQKIPKITKTKGSS